MKHFLIFFLAMASASTPLLAQFSGRGGGPGLPGPQGPRLGGALSKVFGEHKNFQSTLVMISEGDNRTEMKGTLSFAEGKTRFEMDMSNVKSSQLNPAALSQMKMMGMATIIMITRPDKQSSYMIYPGLDAHVELALQEPGGAMDAKQKLQYEEIARESLDGHPCVKNKVTIIEADGKKQESIVWNATDLKNFPIQIQHEEGGLKSTMQFSLIKFEPQPVNAFEPPQKSTRYEDFASMVQGALMKRLGGGGLSPQGK